MIKRNLFVFSLLIASAFLILSSCKTEEKEDVMTKQETKKAKIALMLAEGFQDAEAYMTMGYLYNQGYKVTVIGIKTEEVKAYNSDFTIVIQRAISDVALDDFDALIFPGGKGPAVLRQNDKAVKFAKEFFESGKLTAAICHGPQVLITAGVMDGVTCTAVSSIKEELEEAGARFVDKEVVLHKNLITSRTPPDLHVFSKTIEEELTKQLEKKE